MNFTEIFEMATLPKLGKINKKFLFKVKIKQTKLIYLLCFNIKKKKTITDVFLPFLLQNQKILKAHSQI